MSSATSPHEGAPLLLPKARQGALWCFARSPASTLPLAFICALAVAATAATQIYAYANLLCSDPRHCNGAEGSEFAASVAFATALANGCGLLSLGAFEAMSKRHTRAGLAVWLLVRSMSVGALTFGVLFHNIGVLMSGQVFEGFASDNILHFLLNATYAREPESAKAASLIGYSLALYMLGISISPSIAGILPTFEVSFVMAYGLFVVALVYLVLVVKAPSLPLDDGVRHGNSISAHTDFTSPSTLSWVTSMVYDSLSPFTLLARDYRVLLAGLSLFLYNTAQSYTFSAILVDTSTRFGFTGRENGFLLTYVHLIASFYLFCVLYIAPRPSKGTISASPLAPAIGSCTGERRSAVLACSSLMIQGSALLFFGILWDVWQVYVASAFLAVGLSCPSFIKGYLASSVPVSKRAKALASLAALETSGGLLAPVLLGGIQVLWPGNRVFFVAATLAFLSGAILLITFIGSRFGLFNNEDSDDFSTPPE